MSVRDITTHERFNPNVACLSDQHRTETDGKVFDASVSFADVREFIEKTRLLLDFQNHLWQVHTGKQILHIFSLL
jgi:hypothetical protein